MYNYKNTKQRLYTLSSITKPSLRLDLDCKLLMVTNTANRPSHEREKHTKIIITNKSYTISTVLQVLSHLAQWHNILAFRTSRTAGTSRKHPGKHRHFWMTLWHAGTPLAHLACWHNRQIHGTGKPMMTHHSLNLGRLCWHTQMMSSGLQDG